MGRTVRRWIFIQTNRPAREKVSVSVALIGIRKRQGLKQEAVQDMRTRGGKALNDLTEPWHLEGRV